MRSVLAITIFTSLVSAATVLADVEIGSGFKCSGNSIFKGSREVSYTKAKSNTNKTIQRLKQKLETAPRNKKPGLKNQITQAKAARTLLLACSQGNLDPSQVDPIFTQLASGSGIFNGTYSGLAVFIPISGNIQLVFELEGTVFGATLSLGGQLGSALQGQPLAFQNDVGGIGFPAQFFLTDTFIGDVTLSITKEGQLTITNNNSTTGQINFQGNFGGSTVNGSLSGSYNGFPFNGSATLNKQ
ncbi:MAG: hypothetical protein DCC75_11260 [Proteobacteria bacterium]|nr:MAG: hypothetical protein DCC75_11260 [Pseudomonadota bacterium]